MPITRDDYNESMDQTCGDVLGCRRCGLAQHVGVVPAGHAAHCHRCGEKIVWATHDSRNRLCAALAVAALLLYPLGIFLPVMQLERLGHLRETSIWAGSISLMTRGHMVIGLIVLVCSVVIPVLKLLGLFMLTAERPMLQRRHQAAVFRWIEVAGRWGMIDVLLVALTVAAVKLGDLVVVTPGPGVVAFGACVVLSLLASAAFDPRAIWRED